MANQAIWIGIVIGVFFVGIGVSYAIFGTNEPVQMTDEEHIKTMVYDHEIHDAMMTIMMEDKEHFSQMFKDMTSTPVRTHEFTEKLMEGLDSDAELRMHVMAHLMEDEEFMNQMQSLSP
jgi:hypothetical protein